MYGSCFENTSSKFHPFQKSHGEQKHAPSENSERILPNRFWSRNTNKIKQTFFVSLIIFDNLSVIVESSERGP